MAEGDIPSRDLYLKGVHSSNEGSKACQGLFAAAAYANQHGIAPGLRQDSGYAADVLHRILEQHCMTTADVIGTFCTDLYIKCVRSLLHGIS